MEETGERGKSLALDGWPLPCHMPTTGFESGPQRGQDSALPLCYPGPILDIDPTLSWSNIAFRDVTSGFGYMFPRGVPSRKSKWASFLNYFKCFFFNDLDKKPKGTSRKRQRNLKKVSPKRQEKVKNDIAKGMFKNRRKNKKEKKI